MTQPGNPKRPICDRCRRPQPTCICQWIIPIESTTEVLFLQHPLEVNNAKGSARLLHLSLPGSRISVGEKFADNELHALLHAPFFPATAVAEPSAKISPLLLYPADPEHQGEPVSFNINDNFPSPLDRYRLVVLDGTWRKSRKMLHLNPLLTSLPRLALHNPPPSRYAIRKAHQPDQLSTFEATCYALMQLEKDEKYRSLLAAFNGFVTQQQSYAESDRPVA